MKPTLSKRPRIAIGVLVTSTNNLLRGCAQQLTIHHYYNPINYNRIKRVVAG